MFMFHVHTNKHTHTRAYIQISFIISAYLSPLQGQWWIHFQRPFHYTNTYSHDTGSHTCVARSLRGWPLIRRCVMGGLSLGCMYCICVWRPLTACPCLSTDCGHGCMGCVCVHVPPLIIFSFDNAWRFHIAHSLALIYAAAAGAAVTAAAAFGCPFWSFCVFYSSIKLAIICFFYWFFKWALCVVSNYEFSIDLKSTIYIHTHKHTKVGLPDSSRVRLVVCLHMRVCVCCFAI